MTSYNIQPLRSKSSLGGFKMHHDKFISEFPSVSQKVRVVTLNAEMQTLINCKNCLLGEEYFPGYKEQASYIYCRTLQVYSYAKGGEGKLKRNRGKRLMNVSAPRLLSHFFHLPFYLSFSFYTSKKKFIHSIFKISFDKMVENTCMSVNLFSNERSTVLNIE